MLFNSLEFFGFAVIAFCCYWAIRGWGDCSMGH